MKNTKKKTSKKDKALLITGSIFALFVALICLFIIVYPKLLTVPDVTIPDVSNLSVVEAEKKLKELGLLVASDVIEKESDEVEPGTVIGTNPQAGRTVKENTEISIIVAKESDNIKIENYVGQNYKTVEVNLKNAGLNVITEPKKIEKEEQNKYKEDTVVDQSTKENDYLEPGDTIIIYYAVYTVEYPDFVTENYTVEMVQQFCDKNNIVLNIHYETNDSYPEGTIIKQDRTGEVISGSTLTITVCENTKVEEESEGLE